jgi:hypothetical protein
MLLAVKETVWSNMQNSLHQNLPTHIVKVFSNLEIMQYQYPASNQYWKTASYRTVTLLAVKQTV